MEVDTESGSGQASRNAVVRRGWNAISQGAPTPSLSPCRIHEILKQSLKAAGGFGRSSRLLQTPELGAQSVTAATHALKRGVRRGRVRRKAVLDRGGTYGFAELSFDGGMDVEHPKLARARQHGRDRLRYLPPWSTQPSRPSVVAETSRSGPRLSTWGLISAILKARCCFEPCPTEPIAQNPHRSEGFPPGQRGPVWVRNVVSAANAKPPSRDFPGSSSTRGRISGSALADGVF